MFPSVTARSGYAARTSLHHAFVAYYRRNGHAHASQLIRDRFKLAQENGLSLEELASLELSTLFAALHNSILAAFWVVYHVYADKQLLRDLRKELGVQVRDKSDKVEKGEAAGEESKSDDEKNKDQATPLLTSLIKETLRVHSASATTRYVTTDTTLSSIPSPLSTEKEGYLLKSGSLVVIPTEHVHNNPSIWGADATTFNPYRFHKHTTGVKIDGSRISSAAFRAFGAGTHICPGRFLAGMGVESLVKILVKGWELDAVSGDWELGMGVANDVSEGVRPPDGDIEVCFRRRGDVI